jgi:hypothetical protein
MNIIDSRLRFRANARFDNDGGLVFEKSTIRVHFLTSQVEPLALEFTRICGGMLGTVPPSFGYWDVSEGAADGAFRTLEITFNGDRFSESLRETLIERSKWNEQPKEKKESIPRPKELFKTTGEEALYHAFVTNAELQLELKQRDVEEAARLVLTLDYMTPCS